jgi:hypothetical protein
MFFTGSLLLLLLLLLLLPAILFCTPGMRKGMQ